MVRTCIVLFCSCSQQILFLHFQVFCGHFHLMIIILKVHLRSTFGIVKEHHVVFMWKQHLNRVSHDIIFNTSYMFLNFYTITSQVFSENLIIVVCVCFVYMVNTWCIQKVPFPCFNSCVNQSPQIIVIFVSFLQYKLSIIQVFCTLFVVLKIQTDCFWLKTIIEIFHIIDLLNLILLIQLFI